MENNNEFVRQVAEQQFERLEEDLSRCYYVY